MARGRTKPPAWTADGGRITSDGDPYADADVVTGDVAHLRSYELDALSSILPPDRRDRMAEILTEEDVATLKHLAEEGMGRNTLRASVSAQLPGADPKPWPRPWLSRSNGSSPKYPASIRSPRPEFEASMDKPGTLQTSFQGTAQEFRNSCHRSPC